MPDASPPVPRPASTILLLRDLDPVEPGFEVFMIERSGGSKFMGGAYVFPGGRVEDDDAAQITNLAPQEASALFPDRISGDAALAFLGAARRELREESLVDLPPHTEILPFAHWITPPVEMRRFDTWFFVALLPPGVAPGHDDREAVSSRWVDPRRAFDADGRPRLLLPPPTYHSLWDLARFERAADVLDHAKGRPLPACTPSLEFIDGAPTIVLPGDPLHPADPAMPGPSRLHLGLGDAWWAVSMATWGRPRA